MGRFTVRFRSEAPNLILPQPLALSVTLRFSNLKGVDMKFIKLHQDGRAFLVNLSNVSEVYTSANNKSRLFFNSEAGDLTVDESLDEILELIKQVSA